MLRWTLNISWVRGARSCVILQCRIYSPNIYKHTGSRPWSSEQVTQSIFAFVFSKYRSFAVVSYDSQFLQSPTYRALVNLDFKSIGAQLDDFFMVSVRFTIEKAKQCLPACSQLNVGLYDAEIQFFRDPPHGRNSICWAFLQACWELLGTTGLPVMTQSLHKIRMCFRSMFVASNIILLVSFRWK